MRPDSPGTESRSPELAPADRLESWKEIATHLHREIRTVQRWEHERGLPIHRVPGSKRGGAVYAFRLELESWWEKESARIETPPRREWHLRRLAVIAAGIVCLAGLALWLGPGRNGNPEVRAAPLTNLPGAVLWPAFSPDGKQVAFAWNGVHGDNFDIYLQQIGSGQPHRLTESTTLDWNPVFSPDGLWIAFLRHGVAIEGEVGEAVFVIPVLGGQERMISRVRVAGFSRSLAWSGDGRWLIVAAGASDTEPGLLLAYPLDGGSPRRLTKPGGNRATSDRSPVLSPDGRYMAFLRSQTGEAGNDGAASDGEILVLPLGTGMSHPGEPIRVTAEKCDITDLAWAGNGEILYVRRQDGVQRVMRAKPFRSASPRAIPSIGPVGDIAVSPRSDRLVFSTSRVGSQIWRLPLGGDDPPVRVAWSQWDMDPRFSPDGSKIAFISARSGRRSLWITGEDGSNALELASFDGGVSAPHWSPDGTEIAFTGRTGGNTDVWAVAASGGKPRRVTSHPADDSNPTWSRDGRWIYFSSTRTGQEQVFKTPSHPAKGSGAEEAIPVTRGGGHLAMESEDGRYLYFLRAEVHRSVWRIPVAGGDEVRVTLPTETVLAFDVANDGLWLQTATEAGFEAASGDRHTPRLSVPMTPGSGFTVEPGERPRRRILFAATEFGSGELWLVENFR